MSEVKTLVVNTDGSNESSARPGAVPNFERSARPGSPPSIPAQQPTNQAPPPPAPSKAK